MTSSTADRRYGVAVGSAAGFDVDVMVGDLGRLVDVESPSRDVAAVTAIGERLADLMRATSARTRSS